MDFVAIMDQAIALLRQRGRLTYRTLQVQFQLDDAHLEVLKDELIAGQRLAVDEEGRVLVWTGGTTSVPPTASPLPLSATPEAAPAQGEVAAVAPATPAAERRQLTVLFCDLVDSTVLASQLDPEDLREVVRAYQDTCAKVIARFEGHIAQYLGDGLLVYFGYPLAHEDDAQRAVRTGLGIVEAMRGLNTRLEQERGVHLAVRLGMHTGLVVVGDMGGPGRQEHLALGEVPNIASRIEGLAEANTVAISEATYRLIHGYFECQDLGAQTLRGVAEPVHVYRVLQDSGARGRLDVAVTRGLTPLVGREQEIGLLVERWDQAKVGHGQVVLVSGEAGIGKSRLVQMLKERVVNEPHVRWECRSVPYYQNTALYPLTDLFQRTLQWQPDETPDAKLGKLEHALSQYRLPLGDTVPLFAPVLALPVPENRYHPLNLSPQRQRQKTLETLVAILLELAERQPVLLIIEDLHWTDPTTLELLNLVLDQTPTASMLVLLTCRSHFQPAWHHRSYLTEITVNRLSPIQVEQIVAGMTDGKTFPAAVLQQIIEKTDGVPLFVEEMTKALLESGHLQAVESHYELIGSLLTLAIPATLHDSLMARLDRLVTAKAIAQYAAVIGRGFAYDLLQAVSQLDEATLQRELGRLVEAEIVYQRGVPPQATYTFKHALIQDAAYESLLRSTRQQYHQRIAQVLETQFPETAEAEPELLAHHYTEAGRLHEALGYWYTAGQRAMARAANQEAVEHLRRGLAILPSLPDTLEYRRYELDFQVQLGHAVGTLKGWANPELEPIYQRAYVLCHDIGNTTQLSIVLQELGTYYSVGGNLLAARQAGEELLHVAQQEGDPMGVVAAYVVLGEVLSRLGDHGQALAYYEHGIALYRAQPQGMASGFGTDFGVACLNAAALNLWVLGYPDQAMQKSQAALALADEVASLRERAAVLSYTTRLHVCRQDWQETLRYAEATLTLSQERGIAQWIAHCTIFRGRALAAQGQHEQGIALMQQGLSVYRAGGSRGRLTHFLAMLAEAQGAAGQVLAAKETLEEALTLAEGPGEPWIKAELYRLKGELLRQDSTSSQGEGEACFHHALALARNQHAKSWELRTATSLARLWQSQDKRQDAYDLLAPVYSWFAEGFGTADLQDARALLKELAGECG